MSVNARRKGAVPKASSKIRNILAPTEHRHGHVTDLVESLIARPFARYELVGVGTLTGGRDGIGNNAADMIRKTMNMREDYERNRSTKTSRTRR